MANPKHLEILKKGVEEWNKWRDDHTEILPDLSRAKLSGTDLHEAGLRGEGLSGVNLSGAILARWRRTGWTSRIDERIAELERLRAVLTECIGCGCLSLDRCRLANPGDRAARSGPGPRYWVGDPRRPT